MPGINLSQSAPVAEQKESRRSTASSKAVYLFGSLLVVAGLAYGALMFYSFDMDKKQAAIREDIQRVKMSYASESMLRAAKFSIKGDAITVGRSLPDVNLMDELQVMSSHILPDVVLQSYENDFSKNIVKISGKAPALFRIAQQMKSLRESGNFSDVTLNGPIVRGDDGLMTFSLDLIKVIEQKQN